MTIYNPFWWVRKKHHEDYEQAFKDAEGCEKQKWSIKFNGPNFWEAFTALGHTSTVVEECDCWKKRHETDCPYKEEESCFRGLDDCNQCPDRVGIPVRLNAARKALNKNIEECEYCKGVGACPRCWGRAALTRAEKNLSELNEVLYLSTKEKESLENQIQNLKDEKRDIIANYEEKIKEQNKGG